MTALVAWRDRFSTHLGVDSQWTAGNERGLTDQKIWRNGDYIIGAAGSFRSIQVLRRTVGFNGKMSTRDIEDHRITEWVPKIQEAFQAQGLLLKAEDKTPTFEIDLLVASKKALVRLSGDFSVMQERLHYAAGGGAEDLALGYLAGQKRGEGRGYGIVSGALEACARHNNTVSKPFLIMEAK